MGGTVRPGFSKDPPSCCTKYELEWGRLRTRVCFLFFFTTSTGDYKLCGLRGPYLNHFYILNALSVPGPSRQAMDTDLK